MRLRLALSCEDLANRFDISVAMVYRAFQKWLCILCLLSKAFSSLGLRGKSYVRILCHLYSRASTPSVVVLYSKKSIDSPGYLAHSKTYSDHNNIMVKIYLTCDTLPPREKVNRSTWSNAYKKFKNLTQRSGFFSYLEPGDVVLASCGFTIAEDVAIHGRNISLYQRQHPATMLQAKKPLSGFHPEIFPRRGKAHMHSL